MSEVGLVDNWRHPQAREKDFTLPVQSLFEARFVFDTWNRRLSI